MDEAQIENLRLIAVEAYNKHLGVYMDMCKRGASNEESKEPIDKAQMIWKKAHEEWAAAAVELKIAGIKARGQKAVKKKK